MKVFSLLFFLCILSLSAENVYPQQKELSLDLRNVTISKVISEIEKTSDYVFLITDEAQSELNKRTSVRANKESIRHILESVLKNTNLGYSVVERQVSIYKDTESKASEKPVTVTEEIAQQKKSITGRVTDKEGVPIIGANIVETGTTNGTVTDIDGKFSFNVEDDAVLQISYIGYLSQEINTAGRTNIDIVLQEDTQSLEELVVVGYGVQKKGNLTGAISTVNSAYLVKAPVASTSNAIAGKLPGVISKQGAGSPGKDEATLSIRGFGSPLVIVDGVEGNFNTIDANEIESISVLKDASAAIYGARAGNGVILVTTKRGKDGKPTITLNSTYTSQSNTRFLNPVNAGQYAEMARQRWHENGEIGIAPFSEKAIALYYAGTDPDYPNTNWFDVIIRNSSPMMQHNLSIRGGSDKIKYYAFLGYLDQQSFLKSNDGNYTRYNIRTNFDVKINNNLLAQFDLSSIIAARKFPIRVDQGGGFYQDLWNQKPIYPSSLPDPTKFAYAGAEIQIVAESRRDGHGYRDNNNQNLKGNLAFTYTFPSIKGLSAKAFANYSKDYNNEKLYERPYASYLYNNQTGDYIQMQYLNNSVLTQNNYEYQEITGQLSLNYERTFKDHYISVLTLYELIDSHATSLQASRGNFLEPKIDYLFGGSEASMTNYGAASEMGRASFIGRMNYSYKNRYLVDATLRRDASAKFAPDGRWGTFPSISLGWRISEEGLTHIAA